MTRSEVQKLLVVAGSLHFDILLNAPHLPRPDETVLGSGVRFTAGGKGGNQAVAAALHGASVSMIGVVGVDWMGNALIANLTEAGVDIRLLSKTGLAASGMSVAIIEPSGSYGAVVASGSNSTLETNAVELPESTGMLLLQNEVPEPANLRFAREARARQVPVVLNAAPMRQMAPQLLDVVDILVVNRVEAEVMLEAEIADPSAVPAVLERRRSGPRHLIATLGGDGLVHHELGKRAAAFAPYKVQTISTHGAGDVFTGAFCARLICGDSFRVSLGYAQAAAAIHVSTTREARRSWARPDYVSAVQALLDIG